MRRWRMKKAKKIVNDPKNVVSELIQGLVEAYHGRIKLIEGVNALVKTSLPAGKVGLLIGGGTAMNLYFMDLSVRIWGMGQPVAIFSPPQHRM
jgi:dihydroxyacetone kinase-like protein